VANQAHHENTLEITAVFVVEVVRHLAHNGQHNLAHLAQQTEVRDQESEVRSQRRMHSIEKYLADLADQAKRLENKALTMSVLVRHLADQKRLTWRSSRCEGAVADCRCSWFLVLSSWLPRVERVEVLEGLDGVEGLANSAGIFDGLKFEKEQ